MRTQEGLQKEALELSLKAKVFFLEWGTGIGKSKVAIDIISNLLSKNSEATILLVVAETAHKSNWRKEFGKWGLADDNITITTYASLKKYKNLSYNLGIFDEGHHLYTDIKLDILSEIIFDQLIILSATIKFELFSSIGNMFRDKGIISKHTITLQQAIDWGILPAPKIYIIPLKVDNNILKHEIKIFSRGKGKRKKVVCDFYEKWSYIKDSKNYPNIDLYIRGTDRDKLNYLDKDFEYWKKRYFQTQASYVKDKWLSIGLERKSFISSMKTPYLKELTIKLKNKRYIMFCGSIDQADNINSRTSIHSKKDNSLGIIDRFNEKKISNLIAVGMLQEGQNLTDIEVGVIGQLDGSSRSFIQKFGRSMRAEDPIQIILYYRNSRDEEYLNNILTEFDSDYITFTNIEEIEI